MCLDYNSNFEYFMGHCTSSQKRTNPKGYHFECEPAGTEALKDKSLPKLLFHAVLANVKLKKYPYVFAYAIFRRRQLPISECEKGRTSRCKQKAAGMTTPSWYLSVDLVENI